MIKLLPRLASLHREIRQKESTEKPSFEARLTQLYEPKYDISAPIIYHKREVRFERNIPYISNMMTYVSSSCVLVGDVEIGDMSVILPNSVIRAEYTRSAIGDNVFIAENTHISQAPFSINSQHNGSFMIGDGVAIGPNCILRACTIEPHAFIGEGCKIFDGATVETCSVLLPGSVVPEGAVVKEDEVWGGQPAQFIRKTTEEEQEKMYAWIMEQYQVFSHLRVTEEEAQTLSRYFVRYWDNVIRSSAGERLKFQRPKYIPGPPRSFFSGHEDDKTS